jgi:hypothetical protein
MLGREIKVLLIGRKPSDSSLEGRLRKCGCHCCSASSYDEASSLLRAERFDLVLSPMTLRHTSMYGLMELLDGSDVTLCYWQAVEIGCWWLPAIERGKSCFGTCALRSGDFAAVLDKIIDGLSWDAQGPQPPHLPASNLLQKPQATHYELVVIRSPQAAKHTVNLATASRKEAG